MTVTPFVALIKITQTQIKACGGDALIAVDKPFYGVKRGSDPENVKECVWIDIFLSNNINLLLGNHYFSPDCNLKTTENYFHLLEQN
jgi:hypothetical protein